MEKRIYLEPNQVPAHLRGGYSGKQFKAVVCTQVTVPSHAGLWSGGSRDTYRAINFATGDTVTVSNNFSAPWDKDRGVSLKTWKPETQAGRACKAALVRWSKCPPIQGVKEYKIRGWRHFWLDETHPKYPKALIYRREMDRRERSKPYR